ncbi:MAG: hypothetical protein ACRDOD_25690 [Streptosporangiaceae bacterium]
MRRLYYRDSYGQAHRDRRAERGSGSSGIPAKFAVRVLLVLAVVIVLASLLHL